MELAETNKLLEEIRDELKTLNSFFKSNHKVQKPTSPLEVLGKMNLPPEVLTTAKSVRGGIGHGS